MGYLLITVVTLYLLGAAIMYELIVQCIAEDAFKHPKTKWAMAFAWPLCVICAFILDFYMKWDAKKHPPK